MYELSTYQTTTTSQENVVELEESGELVRLVISHEVLDAKDGGKVGSQHRPNHWESRERCLALHIAGEVLGEVYLGQLREDEISERSHCLRCEGVERKVKGSWTMRETNCVGF